MSCEREKSIKLREVVLTESDRLSQGRRPEMAQETLMEVRRQELLALLDRYTDDGVRRVNWLTTQDDRVCALCRAREQRVLTVAEARDALKGRFCESNDPQRGCLCTLTVVEGDFDEMP
jgi:hypothetical protein